MTKQSQKSVNVWTFPFEESHQGKLSQRQWCGVILFFVAWHYLALFASLLFIGNFEFSPNHDHYNYVANILERGYPDPHIGHVPPLFSYYLTFKTLVMEKVGLPYWGGKFAIDVFAVVLSGVLSVVLGRILTRNTFLAIASGVGLVSAPIFILGVAEGEAAIFFQPVFLLALILLVKELQRSEGPRFLGILCSGLVMGVATLIRGNPQYIIFFLGPWVLWIVGRKWGSIGLLRGALVIAIFWFLQNMAMMPWAQLQKQTGSGDGLMPFRGVYAAYFKGLTRHPGNSASDWVKANYRFYPRTLDGALQFNKDWLQKDPRSLIELYFLKVIRAWYMSDTLRWDKPTLLLHFPYWVMALAGVYLWGRKSRGDPAFIFLLLLIVYMQLISAAMDGIARYSGPIYGFIGTFCGVCLIQVKSKFFSRSG